MKLSSAVKNLLTYYYETAEADGDIDFDVLDKFMRQLKTVAEKRKYRKPLMRFLSEDVERVLGNLILEFGVEGEERKVWHRLQKRLGM